jgi:hypothetical protein
VKYRLVSPPLAGKQTYLPRLLKKRYIKITTLSIKLCLLKKLQGDVSSRIKRHLIKITDSDRAMPNKKVKPQNGFPFLLGTYQKITAVAIALCLKII